MNTQISTYVAILIATYNGADWIATQLDSIYNQDYKNFHIFASDDASSDQTLTILKQYEQKYPGTITITQHSVRIGCTENFRSLLKQIDASFYFFCDQDDWWYPHKISTSLQLLEKINQTKPCLVFSDLEVTNSLLDITSPSLWQLQRTPPALVQNVKNLHVCNVVTGCTMAFNHAAKELVKNIDFIPCHDHAIALHLVKNGAEIIPIHEPLVKYRQSSQNFIGARPFYDNIKDKITSFNNEGTKHLIEIGLKEKVFSSKLDYVITKLRLWIKRAYRYN